MANDCLVVAALNRRLMSQEQWTAVDNYITDLLIPPDPALEAALRASAEAGLPAIQVSPPQGKLLHLLARIQGARAILEIGTLGGYSTIWLARALPAGGRLITLEVDPKHAEIARANIARAGLAHTVELRARLADEIGCSIVSCRVADLVDAPRQGRLRQIRPDGPQEVADRLTTGATLGVRSRRTHQGDGNHSDRDQGFEECLHQFPPPTQMSVEFWRHKDIRDA